MLLECARKFADRFSFNPNIDLEVLGLIGAWRIRHIYLLRQFELRTAKRMFARFASVAQSFKVLGRIEPSVAFNHVL
jgi:hypothetical protein